MITSQINIKCTSMIWCPATSLTVVYKMVNRLALYFDLATSSWARTLISGKRGGVRGWYMSSSHIRLFFRSSYVSFVRVDFSVLRICHICSQLLSVLLTYDDIYCTFHHLSLSLCSPAWHHLFDLFIYMLSSSSLWHFIISMSLLCMIFISMISFQ